MFNDFEVNGDGLLIEWLNMNKILSVLANYVWNFSKIYFQWNFAMWFQSKCDSFYLYQHFTLIIKGCYRS